ncbi:nicotinamide-nucleotide amidase [Exilibacterium tricleocarpae]|uniref:Nicotinamide-nucleotide amidase n=2 Tax=Exilibacterium tricleocarpae TaxID=2591008 RepID=A0A545U726_9GAMM|nr:nicotinamide-nucleotide amidase [Exilibacterium tricleocarpae]TQV85275.1 nicotinamide-nucleotide amidase [Exilibacterium tricleocarpae]
MEAQIHQLAGRLGELLGTGGGTVTTAESCTGGGVAAAITEIPGSSAWFEYGFVTYANTAKSALVGVDPDVLRSHGAVSEPVVSQMARGALAAAAARVAVAVSGIAGPDGGSAEKPVGTVWFAWARDDGRLITAHRVFAGDRAAVRRQAVACALQGLIDTLSAWPER